MAEDLCFDYVVIGAGTAGCLLANRLTRDPSLRVLLIEAGGRDDYLWVHIPVGYLRCIGNPRTDWMFRTEPEPALNGRSLRYPRGKVLGGSSSINGMIYMRGQARDYEEWARQTGEPAWGWAACLEDFKRHEDHHAGHVAPFAPAHGVGGEWRVERQRLRWEILDAFAEAAVQAGLPRRPDFNQGDNEGVGYFEVNQRAGWRWNTARAFLRPTCYGRPNFELWTGATVTRLAWQHDGDGVLRCTGAEVRTPSGVQTVRARREVVLAAGSIGSPHLLQVSGVGPATALAAAGVRPVWELPGVGANLQDHLQIRAVYQVSGTRTLNTLAAHGWGRLRIGLEYALRRTGPLSMAPSQLGAFARSDPQQPAANLQFHVQPLSLDAFGEPLHRFDAITASVCHLNPSSRGRVQAVSSDIAQPPQIQPNYLSTESDRQTAVAALRWTRRIVGQPALARFQPREWQPGPEHQSDAELLSQVGAIGTTIFHPVGTCRMGRDNDPDAVVDARLRVRGVRALRVVDASVMPTLTSGNTNAPTLMIAEKAAAWMREERVATP